MSIKSIMTRFVFRCPPLAPLRPISRQSVKLLRAGYMVLVEHGPAALAEFKRMHAAAAEWDRIAEQMRDASREKNDEY